MTASRYKFKIYSFDTDAFGNLTAPGLLGYLLEAAGRSADSLGFGIEELQRRGLTWVIARIKIELLGSLRFGDEIEVETWPSGLMRSAAMREFRLWQDGQAVGQATSLWFVLDMTSRLPVHPDDVFPANLRAQSPHLVTLSRSVVGFDGPPEVEHRFSVRFADIDLNHHVTAASYIAWAMEAVPEAAWENLRLQSMDVQYLEECHHGHDVITSSVSSSSLSRSHRITRATDQREIARLETSWAPRRAQR
jgi:acyl-ACP thioesterase